MVPYALFLDHIEHMNRLAAARQGLAGSGYALSYASNHASILPSVFMPGAEAEAEEEVAGAGLEPASNHKNILPVLVAVAAPSEADKARADALGVPSEMQGAGIWNTVKHVAHALQKLKLVRGLEKAGISAAQVALGSLAEKLPVVGSLVHKGVDFAADKAKQAIDSSGSGHYFPGVSGSGCGGCGGCGGRGGSLLMPGRGAPPVIQGSESSFVRSADRQRGVFHPNQMRRA